MNYESTCTVASVIRTRATIGYCFAALEADVLLVFCVAAVVRKVTNHRKDAAAP